MSELNRRPDLREADGECDRCGRPWLKGQEDCDACSSLADLAECCSCANTSEELMRVSMLIARALALDYLKAANAKAMLFAVQNAVGACRIVEVESKLKQLWLSSGPQLGFREETPSEISSKEVALTKRRLKTVTDAKA